MVHGATRPGEARYNSLGGACRLSVIAGANTESTFANRASGDLNQAPSESVFSTVLTEQIHFCQLPLRFFHLRSVKLPSRFGRPVNV
jgi:hypothetical protein